VVPPLGTCHIGLKFSADAVKAMSDQISRAILKIYPNSSLDYRACHVPSIRCTYVFSYKMTLLLTFAFRKPILIQLDKGLLETFGTVLDRA
jgi:hypothetical protein